MDVLHNIVSSNDNEINVDTLMVEGIGSFRLNLPNSLSLTRFTVLYVLNLYANLISVSQLVQQNCVVLLSSSSYLIQELQTGKMIGVLQINCGRFVIIV